MTNLDLSPLVSAVDRACRGWDLADREDLVQSAFSLALEDGGPSDLPAVLGRAEAQIPRLIQEKRNAVRRGARVVSPTGPDEHFDVVNSQTHRESRRRLRPPKGTIPITATGAQPTTGIVRHAVGDLPDSELLHIAARFQEVTARVLSGLPISREEALRLKRAYLAAFDSTPSDSWVDPLLIEIEAAKRRQIAAEALPNSPGTAAAPALAPTDEDYIVIGPKDDEGVVPNDRSIKLPARRITVAMHDGRIWEKLVATYNGREYVAYVPPDSIPSAFTGPVDATRLAQSVLSAAIARIASIPGNVTLPDYVLDTDLLVWLVQRTGFDAGGGSKVLKTDTIKKLLLDPAALALAVQTHGKRVAKGCDVRTAAQARLRFCKMAARIRKHAGLYKPI